MKSFLLSAQNDGTNEIEKARLKFKAIKIIMFLLRVDNIYY